MTEMLPDFRLLFTTLLHIAAASAVTIDAVLRKRHVQAIIGWIGLAWFAPFLGAAIYFTFGINRIHRAAVSLRIQSGDKKAAATLQSLDESAASRQAGPLAGLDLLGRKITGRPLLPGNSVVPLINGDEAFPAMLSAIDAARQSIALQSYIFDADPVGELFGAALARAAARGVAVRILIDDVGSRYSRPTMIRVLQQHGLEAAAFLPTQVPRLFRYANLRNHRKIMVVDGRVGFMGGLNLRCGHWLARKPRRPVRCVHFQVEGPAVADLQRVFAADWTFTTGELLEGATWFPPLEPCGTVNARGIADGPDEDLGKMPDVLLGALAAARRSVHIITPYFLPDDVLLRALQVTSLRGVEVKIVLPGRSNVPIIDWAMQPQLPYLLDRGCRIFLSPLPFDHMKLFVVDGSWSLIGSTNWDARSLRLNFEFNLECYDQTLAGRLQSLAEGRIQEAKELFHPDLPAHRLVRIRNGLARLLSPYL